MAVRPLCTELTAEARQSQAHRAEVPTRRGASRASSKAEEEPWNVLSAEGNRREGGPAQGGSEAAAGACAHSGAHRPRCAVASVRSACFRSTTTHSRSCSLFRMTFGVRLCVILLGSHSSQAMSLRACWIRASQEAAPERWLPAARRSGAERAARGGFCATTAGTCEAGLFLAQRWLWAASALRRCAEAGRADAISAVDAFLSPALRSDPSWHMGDPWVVPKASGDPTAKQPQRLSRRLGAQRGGPVSHGPRTLGAGFPAGAAGRCGPAAGWH